MSASPMPGGASRRQTNSVGCALAVIWGFAAIWYGFLVFFTFIIRRSSEPQTGPLVVVGVFALAGLLLVGVALRATRDAIRFRGAELELQTIPAVLGGKVSGAFRVPKRVLRLAPLEAYVAMFRRHHGRHSSPDEMLWEASEPVGQPFMSGGDLATLPFSIRLPYDAEASSYDFYWKLDLRAGRKGSISFPITAERTAQSNEQQTRITLRPTVNTAPRDTEVKIEPRSGGIDVEVPPPGWAWKWFAFLVTATAVGIIAAKLILMRMEAPEQVFALAYTGIVCVAGLLAALSIWSLSMYVRRVHADRKDVEIRYALARRRPTRLTREQVADITAGYSSSSLKYKIEFVRTDGAPMYGTLLYVKTKAEADWIATELRRAIFGTAHSAQ